jgi:hypothetical protein
MMQSFLKHHNFSEITESRNNIIGFFRNKSTLNTLSSDHSSIKPAITKAASILE